MDRIERYVKRQIMCMIANRYKIDNLHDVSKDEINEAYEKKEIFNYDIKMDVLYSGDTYFAFIDKNTGYSYGTAILKPGP